MWIRIRAVIVEDEPLAAQYLAEPLDETCQVEVVGSATESEAGLRLCAELRPDAVFVDINLPGKDGVSLATQLAILPQPPRLVFTTGNANRAMEAFRLEAVDYLLKPLDPEQVTEAVNRLLAYLRPFEVGSFPSSADLELPFATYNAELLAELDLRVDREIAWLKMQQTTSSRAKRVLKCLLGGEDPEIQEVARELGMSSRTLQRRIAEEGSNFRQLISDARRELARLYLLQPSLGLSQAASLLGYENPNSFLRAFRVWEGVTPTQWRAMQKSELSVESSSTGLVS